MDEHLENERVTRLLPMLLCLLLPIAACTGRDQGKEGPATTQTIAPVAPQPSPTGTDAMTQTVDVEDGRSEEEGGALVTSTSTAKTPAKSTAPKPVKKPKKKK